MGGFKSVKQIRWNWRILVDEAFSIKFQCRNHAKSDKWYLQLAMDQFVPTLSNSISFAMNFQIIIATINAWSVKCNLTAERSSAFQFVQIHPVEHISPKCRLRQKFIDDRTIWYFTAKITLRWICKNRIYLCVCRIGKT